MDLIQFFQTAVKKKVSDLYLISEESPVLRIDGELEILDQPPLKSEELKKGIYGLLTEKQIKKLEQEWELDFAYEFFKDRFRINLHFQKGGIALAARRIPQTILLPEEMDFNETLYQLTHLNQGLVLVTGPSGSGKSTTLAAMIDVINKERKAHIITIEDPIEFFYQRKQSIIEQREVDVDTYSFNQALKYILRQDPNVILVGEMRDLDTISNVLTAAETGHLVFSTLHTNSASETIERIIDVFPSNRQKQILVQLSATLKAVISQQLLPRIKSGRVAAREILINTPAVANLIRQNNITQITSIIQTSAKEGMVTMDKAIKELERKGIISSMVAKNRIKKETLETYY